MTNDTQINATPTGQPDTTPHNTPPPTVPTHKHSPEGIQSVVSTIVVIVMAPIIALCLTAFFFQSYQVDGPSMESTLQNSDRLIVLKVYKTWSKITRHAYIPHRGDIIVFEEANIQALDQGGPKQLIKRVIGLPGERIVINSGNVAVYNKQHPNGFSPDKTMPYGSKLPVTTGNVDITIQANQIFVMGDNRTNSLDSRVFGTVPAKNIVGKLTLRVLPLEKAQTF